LDDKIEESTIVKNLIQEEKHKLDISFKDVKKEIEQFYNKIILELNTKVNEVNSKLEYCINIIKNIIMI
jgi:hypothetical protein